MRGDVHVLKSSRGARGHEQRGARFAVVLQSDLLPLSTWLVAPTSRTAQHASFRPEVEIEKQSALVLVEQTAAVDPERLGPAVGHLSRPEMDEIDAALRTALGLNR